MTDRRAFTLVELLVTVAIVGVLAALLIPAVGKVRFAADKSQSTSNIRQLAAANLLYANDHGSFSPNADIRDTTHWHGKRSGGKFDGTGGYLSPYLDGGAVRVCPIFADMMAQNGGDSFDLGTGGYGYNATYYGARPDQWDAAIPAGASRDYTPPGNLPARITDPANTVMFTSSAIVRGGGVVETGTSAPYHHLRNGRLGERATPTCHFRFNGEALVAWGDGHVTFELPNDASTDQNVYGDNNTPHQVGWFGDTDWNGPWNPRSAEQLPY
ncbi:type II secretion system protein [Cerasicoccus fimbriatus]|uniref:type II secretion system protein n=1 Tax=Cerasicoccus fimbriatus TaxID=3014554 RepID=UPI0022B4E5EA|nr:type II secretion system protein [Cerasicoccus sp. TK19100]